MARIGILGAGSWGTALAILLHDNGHDVTVWSIHEEEVETLNTTRRHERKLPGVEIPEGIVFTTDMKETMSDKDVCVLAVPSPFIRSTCQKMKQYVRAGQIIVNVAKGIEENTLYTLTDIIEEELPYADACVSVSYTHLTLPTIA